MSKRTLLLSVVFLLDACTHAAPRSVSFSESSSDGLIVFGLASEVGHPITFTFARFDVDTGRVTASSFSGQHYIEHHGTEPRHHVLQVPAGNYVIKDVTIHASNRFTEVCLSAGTVAFMIGAGQQAFLGDFIFDGTTIQKIGANLRNAQDSMRDYPGVVGALGPVGLTETTFQNARRFGNEICGG
ncbi:MAG TPA: hypothetical protein VFS58_07605 [Steroidobacteraceae bacterium]|nr:hypothetical protein [Steroidobacteraceae bacterium]